MYLLYNIYVLNNYIAVRFWGLIFSMWMDMKRFTFNRFYHQALWIIGMHEFFAQQCIVIIVFLFFLWGKIKIFKDDILLDANACLLNYISTRNPTQSLFWDYTILIHSRLIYKKIKRENKNSLCECIYICTYMIKFLQISMMKILHFKVFIWRKKYMILFEYLFIVLFSLYSRLYNIF